MFLSRTNPAQTLNLLLRFNSACLCPLLARLNNTLAGNHGNVFAMGSTCKGGWRCPDIRAYVPGRSSTEFLVGVCRPVLQILTLFQTKKCHFSHPFSDLVSKTHTYSQTWPSRIMSSLLRLEQQQNWNLHISLSFFPFEIETKNTFVHSRSSFETIHIPDSRFQMGKLYTHFQTKGAQIPTL